MGLRVSLFSLAAASAMCLATGPAWAQAPPVTGLLDRYLHGDGDAVVATLRTVSNFDDLLTQLKLEGPAWMAAGGPEDRPRRELAAATFALEAARVDEWTEWKWRTPEPMPDGSTVRAPDILTWKAPPLLIVWGRDVVQGDPALKPLERWWQLAAVAVAERAEDFEFLRHDGVTNLYNPEDEIDYLYHLRQRFPDEPRFKLAEAMLIDEHPAGRKVGIYTDEQLLDDPDVGAEAALRLGEEDARRHDDGHAIPLFERVETKTRDRWLIYLARFFKGQALEETHRLDDAEAAYRSALDVIPHVESASTALAALLVERGRESDAAQVIGAMLDAHPAPADPWRHYLDGDDRFWPTLIARLRQEIAR